VVRVGLHRDAAEIAEVLQQAGEAGETDIDKGVGGLDEDRRIGDGPDDVGDLKGVL
jgi:hypothetical protein